MSLEQLIPVINKLQDVFNTLGTDPIDLPQIVVVGSQSSGKSSVLENIVGRDFLPRGSGIVTRRPLVLQLINLPADSVSEKNSKYTEWGEFLHKPNEMFYDFNQIREEIVKETDRLTGKNKGVSPIAIHLKVYSPHVLNLTLVDLPGITKVPVGDQPTDIELQIRKMVLLYISKPNAIILAVTAANTDLANSDALQIAKEVDPEGTRTIGVITKLDIMDRGTDAMDVLCGRVIPLRLGFIGVVNRSQQDIINNKPIRDSLKTENEYFQNHAVYRPIAARSGTGHLAKTLNRVLMTHIRDTLPDLKVKINKMVVDAQTELSSYGDPLYDTKNSQGALLLQILTRFSSDYRDAIDGKLTDSSTHELYGGARVNYIFNEVFAKCLNSINPTDGLTQNDIRTAIRNATGPRNALFVPEMAFELMVKRQISRLEEPSLQAIELVYDELQRIVNQLESKELARFVVLREKVVEVVNALLQKCRVPSKDMIVNLMFLENAYINTSHPDFVGASGAISTIIDKMAQQKNEPQQSQWGGQNGPQGQMGQNKPNNMPNQGQGNQMSQSSMSNQPNPPTVAAQGKEGFFNMFFGQQQGGMPGQPGMPQGAQNPAMAKGGVQQPAQPQGVKGQPAPKGAAPMSNQAPQQMPSRQSQSLSAASGRPDRLEQPPASIQALNAPSQKEQFETELIQSLLISYFDIVRKNFKDFVPKSIMHFLVNQSKDKIQNELVAHLYKEELFDDLLSESPAIASRRAACKQMLEVLRKAHDILNEVRDFNVAK